MADIIQLNEKEIKSQLGDMVRQSVEDTLNTMLDEEADQITQAHKYERTEKRLSGLAARAVFPISTGKLECFNNEIFFEHLDSLIYRCLNTPSIYIMCTFCVFPEKSAVYTINWAIFCGKNKKRCY